MYSTVFQHILTYWALGGAHRGPMNPLEWAQGPWGGATRGRPHEVIGFGDLWGPSGTSGDHLGTIWDMDSMKLSISLRNRTFRSARIDPSSLPKHRRTNLMKKYPYKKIKYPKRVKKDKKRGKQGWHNKSPIEFCNYPLLIP